MKGISLFYSILYICPTVHLKNSADFDLLNNSKISIHKSFCTIFIVKLSPMLLLFIVQKFFFCIVKLLVKINKNTENLNKGAYGHGPTVEFRQVTAGGWWPTSQDHLDQCMTRLVMQAPPNLQGHACAFVRSAAGGVTYPS